MSALPTAAEIQQEEEIQESLRESHPTSSPEDNRPDYADGANTLLARCGVPELYRAWRLVDFPEVAPVSWDLGGVLIKGPTGTGKSCFASSLLRSRLRHNHHRTIAEEAPAGWVSKYRIGDRAAKWARCGAVLFEARGAFRDGGRSESAIIGECLSPRLLVLDDLCSGKMTDTGWTILEEIIAQRVDSMKDTIVTTNLSLQEIHHHEPRLASRLGAFEEIVMSGQDRRLSKKGSV